MVFLGNVIIEKQAIPGLVNSIQNNKYKKNSPYTHN